VRKAEKTRATLIQAALELFDERGYDSTSASAIAERAGVSEMTFFRHFPSKDAVLIEDPYDPLIAEAIAKQPPHVGALAATIGGVADAWRSVQPPAAGEVRERLRIVARTPSLRGAMTRNSAASEEAITDALLSRGVSHGDARIAAAAAIGALNAALLHWAEGSSDDLGAAITGALSVLKGDGG
jgi:AcrR family transcriptional regulator